MMSLSKFEKRSPRTQQQLDLQLTLQASELQENSNVIIPQDAEGSNLTGTSTGIPQSPLLQSQGSSQSETPTATPQHALLQSQSGNLSETPTTTLPQSPLLQSPRFCDDDITIEETNYLRLILLLFKISTKAVRVLFMYHCSGQLKTLLKNKLSDLKILRERKQILPDQWDLLFPGNGAPKLERFDLSLLMTLLQRLEIIEKPAKGWQELPAASDKSEGADLVRIKLYRNQIVHQNYPSTSNRDFKRLWDELSNAINRISSSAFDYKINHLRIQTLDRTQIDCDREFARAKEVGNSVRVSNSVPIQQWQEDRKTFVETRATKAVQTALSTSNFMVISGDSGSGKSSIAHYYSLNLKEEGYSVIPILSVEEITRLWSEDMKQVFVFDDPFGKNKIDESEIIRWQRFTPNLKEFLKNKNTKIVATTRKHIAKDSQFVAFVTDLKMEINLEMVDISNRSVLLSDDEKKEMFDKHMAHSNKQVTCGLSVTECSLTCFPLLCSLFAKDFQPDVSMEEFFNSPYSVFKKELQDLKNFSKLKYFCLLFCVLYDNKLDIEFIQRLFQNKEEKAKIEAFLILCELNASQSPYEIDSALSSLVDTYLIKDEDTGLYGFVHDFIFDTIVANLPVAFHKSIIEYCSSKFIRERIRFKSMPVSTEEKQTCILLEEDIINVWIDRLFDDIQRGHIYDVFFNPCLQEPLIEEAFVEHLNKKSQAEKLSIACCKEDWSFQEISSDKPCASFNEQYRYNLESLIFRLLQDEECTVLHWAVARKLLKTFVALWGITRSEEKKDTSVTLFLLACFSGSHELAEEMIRNGANIHQANQEGITPIYAAAYNGSDEIAKILFKQGAQLTGIDSKRSTPLIVASYNGHENMVKQLIEKGARVDDQDIYGWSPIYAASYNGHKNIVKILINNGASLNMLNKKCMTPLIAAASNGHEDVLQLLLTEGADLKKTSIYERSALYEAAYRGHEAALKTLLAKATKIMVDRPDENKCTPLHAACNKGHYTSVDMLLKHEANINLQDNNGCTPLFLAASMGHEKVVNLLLENDADVEQCDLDGWSPLYAASMSGHLNVAKMLLQYHANVNVSTTDSESTPLMEASHQGYFQIVEILLGAGAVANARDSYGCTSLYNAAEKGHEKIVRLLLQHGADGNISDNDKRSPCHVAFKNGHANIANLLKEKVSGN